MPPSFQCDLWALAKVINMCVPLPRSFSRMQQAHVKVMLIIRLWDNKFSVRYSWNGPKNRILCERNLNKGIIFSFTQFTYEHYQAFSTLYTPPGKIFKKERFRHFKNSPLLGHISFAMFTLSYSVLLQCQSSYKMFICTSTVKNNTTQNTAKDHTTWRWWNITMISLYTTPYSMCYSESFYFTFALLPLVKRKYTCTWSLMFGQV